MGGLQCHQYTRAATRYVMASLALFFFELNGPAERRQFDEERADATAFLVNEREWGKILTQGLVTATEKGFLDTVDGQDKHRVALLWSAEIARIGHGKSTAPPNVLKDLIFMLAYIKDRQQELVDVLRFPVPYQYFHLLNTM